MPTEEIAILAGGCFWCLEAVYQNMDGVLRVESGYIGGTLPDPTYEEVCSGSTGHAEAVRIAFDPAVTSYRDLLEVFFAIHVPTTPNRQGNDVGTQYRSAIYYTTDQQRATAEELIRELTDERVFGAPIVTELRPTAEFYIAEDYHQNYFRSHPQQPYCAFVVAPKVRKFREKFAQKMRQGT
ncbi:MAG: peptide-methionine (S)-S-oxide reductase MsrA [Acidobacteriia bacterium]|nr:peptide-methionine (S)-S-oxide reductase MsrA [Terriglobia bacterium]